MKIIRLLVFVFFLIGPLLFAQKQSINFGIVPIDLLHLNSYEKDSTANALVLYEYGKAQIKYLDDGPRIFVDYTKRIKILSKQGLAHANVAIPLRKSADSGEKVKVSAIKAYSHTIGESGKVIKTALDESSVYISEIN